MKMIKQSNVYQCWKLAKRLMRDTQCKHPLWMQLYGTLAQLYLMRANHDKVLSLAHKMIGKEIFLGYYYIGLSQFLYGNYRQSEQSIKSIPDYKSISDVVYLYADVLTRQQRIEEAWQLLENISKVSNRKKVWLLMSNLVKTKEDCQRFFKNIEYVRTHTELLGNDKLSMACINAYMRSGEIGKALEVAQEDVQTNRPKRPSPIKNMNTKQANIVLQALKSILDRQEVEFFLISGTLLGCIRENDFLGHDKDIDVGVWDTLSYDELVSKIAISGCFYIIKSRSTEVVKLRHVNGVNVDVFIHHREESDYWHSAVKLKWHNTPFTLSKHKFLGKEYLIPTNYGLYLTENYGDWRQPKIMFDSTYDTPNSEVLNEVEYELYGYRKLQ